MVTRDDGFESIFNKARTTTTRFEDWEFVMAFCDRVNDEPEGSLGAIKVLINKLRNSDSETQMLSLAILEACVKNCGVKFHNEVGKFKLLNELIKLISPKYSAESSSEQLKAKIRSLLFQWRRGLPKQTKILDAYEMLKKEGLIDDEGNVPVAPPPVDETPRDSIISDEKEIEALEKLLKSKDPKDLARANQLIQDRYKKENMKLEMSQHRSRELELVQNNAKLLEELLGHYSVSSSQAEVDLIEELKKSCLTMKDKLVKISEQCAEDDNLLSKVCASSDALVRVLDKYDSISASVKDQQMKRTEDQPPLITSPPPPTTSNNSESILDSLLDLDLTASIPTANSTQETNSDIKLLLEDFGPFNSMPVVNNPPLASVDMLLPANPPPITNPPLIIDPPSVINPIPQISNPIPPLINPPSVTNVSPSIPVFNLDSIEVSKESVQVCPIPAIIAYNTDSVILTISTANLITKPQNAPSLKAAVVTLVNISPFGVENFTLHVASVKDTKLKLFPPSQSSVLPYTPFQSPPIISHILLVQSSSEDILIKLKCSLSIGGRQVTEIIDVSGLKWI